MTRRLRRHEYTVGWVCALPDELTAAQGMLDEEHQDLPPNGNDTNIYCLGSISEHNVVLAALPAGLTGIASATAVAMQMKSTFTAIRFGLMVGIGGGVPSSQVDIRLGDVVVSQPGNGHGGVIQYDFGKSTPSGFDQTGFLNSPPPTLLSAVTKLRSKLSRRRTSLSPHLLKLSNLPGFNRGEAGNDILYEAEFKHAGEKDCTSCDNKRQVQRMERRKDTMEETPMVHYGTIASANQVMRDGVTRDKVSSEFGGVLCFEMEAAGLMNNFPCLVIRGICDYADSHKNKRWQPYAAVAAAAYAKELLLLVPAVDVSMMQTVHEATREYLPFPRNRRFIGRGTELDILRQRLFTNKECQKMALVGLGGVGKTQIALQFTYWVKEHCPDFSIFWMPALSVETFEQACMATAKELEIHHLHESKEDIKYLVQQRLSEKTAGKWLLIVDNADDEDLLLGGGQRQGLLNFLPGNDSGLILFTTRTSKVAQAVVGSDMIQVTKMEMPEAITLFQKVLVQKPPLRDEVLTRDLLSELDCLPLAITQAAAYINSNRSSISEYLRLLKQTEQDAVILMSTEFRDDTSYINAAVAKTWTISFNQIAKHDKVAADLLAFISSIEWKAIPYSILPAVQPEARMESAIGTLRSYSFLDTRDIDGKMLDMHRLVHLATRIWISQKANEVETRRAALKHLIEVFPSDDYTNRDIWRSYMAHAARIGKDEQCQNTEDMSKLCLNVGRCLNVDGRTNEAILWLQKSCNWRDRNLAEEDPDRLASQHALAVVYRANGQIKEAIQLLEHVVAIQARLPEDHPDRLASQHALAVVYGANGRIKEAIQLLEHVVTIKAKLPEDHPDRLASQQALAFAYEANGQIEEAVKLLEYVVLMKRKIMAEHHRSRRASEEWLASLYERLPKKPDSGQVFVPSIEDVVDKDEKGRQFHPALEVSQAISQDSRASTTILDQSLVDQGATSGGFLRRRFRMRRLRGFLGRDK
ncbi:MAG: hypothetical protein Q9165_006334 [Trypethelium subeluteriae]